MDFNLKTATGLTKESSVDVLLQNNVQLLITKQEAIHPSYWTIAWEAPDTGCSKNELSNEHLEMYLGHVNLYKKTNVDGNNHLKDALVTHFADARSPESLSFGFSLRQPAVLICEIQAHQTNDPNVSIIYLINSKNPMSSPRMQS